MGGMRFGERVRWKVVCTGWDEGLGGAERESWRIILLDKIFNVGSWGVDSVGE